ncbi:type I signal peptidase, putative [Plasmodium ovale]|uniref:Type I signal peptidase, putative n=1 Tax=Plasmodium ovale TaxID=36330 RepID=A0A1D3U9S2_PLAOA|nr:type I signal peptidase, putative [Plasmodium ovale]
MNGHPLCGKCTYWLKSAQRKGFLTNKVSICSLICGSNYLTKYVVKNENKKIYEKVKHFSNGNGRSNYIENNINIMHLGSRAYLLKNYALKKRRRNNIRIRRKNKKKNIFNFVRINYSFDFIKKLMICSLLIYGINNYVMDMTLTSGSSMCPLINKNGVILFYICDFSLRLYYELRNIFIYNYLTFLHKFYIIIHRNFQHTNLTSINNRILEKIEIMKKKIKENKNIYKRGDVVLLTSPVNNKKRVCKRIIAIENDKLFIDNFKSFVEIPKDNIWVEGDNKMDSFDSRNYGYVHVNMIIGRVFFLIDPFKNFSLIHRNKNYTMELDRFLFLSS